MRLRFLLSRRWVVFALVVVAMAWGAVRLGEWQFSRLEEREQRNAWTERNLAADPAPVDDVLPEDAPLPRDREWQRVVATGTYAVDDTFVVRYQTRDGDGGVDVVTPLLLRDGTAVLVDRGWVATTEPRYSPADAPAPPTGEVTVRGWARADSTGDRTGITDGSTREISSRAAVDLVDAPLRHGFVDLESESPAASTPLAAAEPPDLGEGPHLFYGIQWWFFGALAIGGFAYLVYDEARGPGQRRRRRPTGGDGAPDEPDGAAGSDEAQSDRRNPPSTGSATPVT